MGNIDIMGLFKLILLVQLFFALCITLVTYTMPEDSLDYVTSFADITETVNLENVATDIESGLEQQTNIPVIELGALVFYSGNILLDLLLNFAFAIPTMIGLLVSGIVRLINLDSFITVTIQLFATVIVTAWYFIAIIQLITGVRSGRIV